MHHVVEWASKGEIDTRRCGQGMDPPYSQAQVLVVHMGRRIKKIWLCMYIGSQIWPSVEIVGRTPVLACQRRVRLDAGGGQRRRRIMRTGDDELAGWRNCQLFRHLSGNIDLRLDCGLKNLCLPVTV